ncbi:hypothetical protein MTR_3g033980 [Medicago truncatula]|uniref:Uncharacterized protein n=1 Tax=Medicago truncatula TaxID=3880 RepID=G7IX64_MEDTR|nr:hypothetical protein MTR_3g033980 [Medicago truncatula]
MAPLASQLSNHFRSVIVMHLDHYLNEMDTLTALESLTLDSLSSCGKGVFLPPKFQPTHSQIMTTLSDLEIGGDNIVHTLLKEQLLPIFLVSLTIANLPEMKYLEGNVLRARVFSSHVAFFSEITCICNLSTELMSLPDMLPSSLESLKFDDCPRLGLLPRDEFPSSLKLLNINGCPLLTSMYANLRSRHVSKIADIPVHKN